MSGTPDQQRQLAYARQLARIGSYEEAAKAYGRLQGTPLEAEATPERLKAIDQHVQRVREQVAKEYVRAQQLKTPAEKVKLLGELYTRLKGVLDAWPETSLRAKAEHNLKVIEQELRKLEPTWFEKQATPGSLPAAGGTAP